MNTPEVIFPALAPVVRPGTRRPIWRIVRFVLYDIAQNRVIIGYTLFLLAASFGLFTLGGDATRGLISLLNIVLLLTPLVSLVFSTIHFYNSYEFIELLAAQPLRRRTILLAQYIGMALAMSLALLVGLGFPLLVYTPDEAGFTLLGVSLALSLASVSLAFMAAVATRDKARGIGVALLMWFYFAFLYDAVVLLLMFSFADYPLEKATLLMVAFNPIDLARVLMLLQLDISALMGYTGALFREFLGAWPGKICAGFAIFAWILLPLWAAAQNFRKKDL